MIRYFKYLKFKYNFWKLKQSLYKYHITLMRIEAPLDPSSDKELKKLIAKHYRWDRQ